MIAKQAKYHKRQACEVAVKTPEERLCELLHFAGYFDVPACPESVDALLDEMNAVKIPLAFPRGICELVST